MRYGYRYQTPKPHQVGTSLDEAQKILGKHRIEKLPIVDSEGCLKGLVTIKDIEKCVRVANNKGLKQTAGTKEYPIFENR